jgi:cell division septation protein DedD
MTSEQEETGEIREFRLEGATLVVVVVVLVVALAGAFYVGRLVERKSRPVGTFADGSLEDPLANVAQSEEPADVDETAGFFDEGEGGEAEPEREARRTLGQPEGGESPAAATPAATPGSHFVQVWAGRDRQAAEVMIEKLQKEGYSVRLFSDRVESDTLYKVRVGGFESEDQARNMATELEQKGYRGAWVTTVR